jgi:putative ABC transport system permease protein
MPKKEKTMFKNYLKIALRNVKNDKIYSFINITGLAVGMVCFILISLYVRYELTYDKYHNNADAIYRVIIEIPYSNSSDGVNIWNCTPFPLKAAIENDFPEVLSATRVYGNPGTVKFKDQIYQEQNLFLVDPEFLEIFSFPLSKGDPETALNDPASVLLTEQTAVKYFGREDPIGKVMLINNEDHKVTGILRTIPKNSHFTFDVLIPFSNILKTPFGRYQWTRWGSIHGPTYILLKEGVNPADLEEKLPAFFTKYAGEGVNYILHLEALKDIHLHGRLKAELELNGDARVVTIFSITGFLILLIACFNYINLSTARSQKKALEVGIRKVVGANKRNLTLQFFMESIFF